MLITYIAEVSSSCVACLSRKVSDNVTGYGVGRRDSITHWG